MIHNHLVIELTDSCSTYPIVHDRDIQKTIIDYFKDNQRKLWNQFPVGMGCTVIAKHNGTQQNQPINVFFMHSDSWGQYGEHTSEISNMVAFVPSDYVCDALCEDLEQFIKNKRDDTISQAQKHIKCPTCRKISEWDPKSVPVRFQTPEGQNNPSCIICCVNDVEVILEKCGHCTLCKQCAMRL